MIFGYQFNQPINNLPDSIQNLTFDYAFNQLIKKIPADLKIVYIDKFNPSIKTISNSILQINQNIKIINKSDDIPKKLIELY